MCSPGCMDRLFINLKVISQVQQGQKLLTTDDYLVLDTGVSYRQVLTRWWMNETRERTLKKIQEVIRSAIYCGQNAINSEIMMRQVSEDEISAAVKPTVSKKVEVRQWELARDKYLQIDNIGLLALLGSELENSLIGLKNLKETYVDDATLRAKFDLEIQLIERHVEKFGEFVRESKEIIKGAEFSKEFSKDLRSESSKDLKNKK